MAISRTQYTAPALEKGLDILELLARTQGGLSQSGIAAELGRTASEIFRMVTILESRGYIARGPQDELFRLTPRLFELAHRHPPSRRLLDVALPVMHRLVEGLLQSCHLAVHHGTFALVTAQVDGPGFIGFAVRIGARAPLPDSCSGLTLLAFREEWQQLVWLQECGLKPESEAGHKVIQHLRRIRKKGWTKFPSGVVRGVVDLGVPVFDHSGSAVASLTVPYINRLEGSPDPEATIKLIQQAAAQISAALGGAPQSPDLEDHA
jgi:DNA-binding IclR family transcriptional regulator